jgi:branched-chain amino acid aminotransferase
MPIDEVDFIWQNGKIVPWHSATTHVMTHGLHYGTSAFEGIRVYDTPDGPAGFRLADHVRRLFDSAKIYQMAIPFTVEETIAACQEVIRVNGLKSAYIRPIAYYAYGEIGVVPGKGAKVDMAIAAFPWGAYLGDTARVQGVDVCVSSWRRVTPDTIPATAKMGGNYLSGLLISREAKELGYAEGIGLDHNGLISEGAGENLFLIKNGRLVTPPSAASILNGITRDTIMKLARDEGLEVIEQSLPREALYLADEAFFTGTAAEVTPIRSCDRRPIGNGSRGPITERLQELFFGLFSGKTADRYNWLEPIQSAQETRKNAKVAV